MGQYEYEFLDAYELLDGTQIIINVAQICTINETDKTKVITMSNGMRIEVKK
jgi:uncharacterized protein YlzI (FlbEa/FlbD family)